MGKTNAGNFFEDFTVGQLIEHATPRTVTEGDRALYGAIYPTRFALPSSAEFARSVGLAQHPVEELIAFHIAFGKTVPDVSLNAVANLGYAELRFHRPVVPGDTLSTRSEVIDDEFVFGMSDRTSQAVCAAATTSPTACPVTSASV